MNPPDDPNDDRWLSGLAREVAPPAPLQERLVGELRRRGRLGGARPRGWEWRLAASVLLAFALGLWFGPRLAAPPAGDGDATPRYLLLLYEPRPIERAGLDLVGEYRAWAGELARSGRLVVAEKLAAEELRFDPSGGASAADRSLAPTGFFLIRAGSRAEAERIAAGCPHLRHGGEDRLRPVDG